MSTSPLAKPDAPSSVSGANAAHLPSRIKIYSHSALLYWWPVWLVGYVMAALTYYQGKEVQVGATKMMIHESANLGLIFFGILFLVILVTNYSVRGLASGIVILGLVLVFVLLLYFDLQKMSSLSLHTFD